MLISHTQPTFITNIMNVVVVVGVVVGVVVSTPLNTCANTLSYVAVFPHQLGLNQLNEVYIV